MERIKEFWDHRSVTTVFRISHENGCPVGCEVKNTRVFRDDCGLGWNFGITDGWDVYWGRKIYILFRFTGANWLASHGTFISLFIALLKNADGDTSKKNFAHRMTIPTPGDKPIHSWFPRDIISHPCISFKVTLGTEVDVDGTMKKRNSPKPAAPLISPAIQGIFQRALITGMFFDTKFIAHSRCASSYPTEPLYAHSTVLGAVQPALLRLCSSSTPDNAPIDYTNGDLCRGLECDISFGEYDSDSDFDETEVKDEPDASAVALIEERKPHNHPGLNATLTQSPPSYHLNQNAVRTVRVHGVALKTLRALIYHCYTTEISFDPLTSSASNKAKDQPLPPDHLYCSPKSMYRLADRIGAEELKKLSLESIRSSLSKYNILDEVFSHFTARYPEVLNMELDLLMENIREPEVAQALPAMMKAVVSGTFPHADEILTKMAVQLQRVK
ncbi:hypothetical protein BJ138DRAFT_322167 [Hygrophoropsis aurantiaca]|uniref:Uncharacterized protein n=1 Tax=Hygrophoropsis aurantiaca TaxID=72124 RepID=A0ACB8A6S4_9AGAM|nr:hypothetical protein BJ138DRAFT_322167 [Hygrophoropsis aurantiaca]